MAIRIRRAFHVQAPYDHVWATLGDFGNEARWASALKASHRDTHEPRVGSKRTCELARPAFGVTRTVEELIAMSPGTITYRAPFEAGPFMSATNTWRCQPDGEGTLVVIDGQVETRGAWWLAAPLLRAMLGAFARKALREFKGYVERHQQR